ncbi:MAG: hypothetical protein ACFE94_06985 [Candidatus Hodarchaeota archaeon]
MVDVHSQSFFGQSTGMFIQSSSKSESFIFMKFIKKKNNGTWEKLSNGEGKTIKCGLEEIVMILEVLKKKSNSWSTVHSFKDEKTQISLNWEGDNKLWFNVGDYPKMLIFTQIEILRLLLTHILEEKIEFSTVPDISKSFVTNNPKKDNSIVEQNNKKDDGLTVHEEMNLGAKIRQLKGKILGETEKALRVAINNGSDIWIPKSTIKSQYNPEINIKQTFLIDSWFLEKNNLQL